MCEVEDPGSSQSLFQMRFDGVGQPGSAQELQPVVQGVGISG